MNHSILRYRNPLLLNRLFLTILITYAVFTLIGYATLYYQLTFIEIKSSYTPFERFVWWLGRWVFDIPNQIRPWLFFLLLGWHFLAVANLFGLQKEGVQTKPVWAIGSYFIPFVNLYKPYQSLKEVWFGYAQDDDIVAAKSEKDPPLLLWWWFSLLSILTVRGLFRFVNWRDRRQNVQNLSEVVQLEDSGLFIEGIPTTSNPSIELGNWSISFGSSGSAYSSVAQEYLLTLLPFVELIFITLSILAFWTIHRNQVDWHFGKLDWEAGEAQDAASAD